MQTPGPPSRLRIAFDFGVITKASCQRNRLVRWIESNTFGQTSGNLLFGALSQTWLERTRDIRCEGLDLLYESSVQMLEYQ